MQTAGEIYMRNMKLRCRCAVASVLVQARVDWGFLSAFHFDRATQLPVEWCAVEPPCFVFAVLLLPKVEPCKRK